MDNFPENLCTSPFKGSHLIILLSAQHISIDLLRNLGLHSAETIRRSYIMKECLNKNHLNTEISLCKLCKGGERDGGEVGRRSGNGG